jgi:hypothetical protein
MTINKEKAIYLGLGVFLLLVVFSSAKGIKAKEVGEESMNQKNFDSSLLPIMLQPPLRVGDSEETPMPAKPKQNFVRGISLKPRFDR